MSQNRIVEIICIILYVVDATSTEAFEYIYNESKWLDADIFTVNCILFRQIRTFLLISLKILIVYLSNIPFIYLEL